MMTRRGLLRGLLAGAVLGVATAMRILKQEGRLNCGDLQC